MTELRRGSVEYRARAFEQDAAEAIRGDVIRALIELITNADDAYEGAPGQIAVSIIPQRDADFPHLIKVQDQARGLTADGMIENFAVLGGEKASSHPAVRGLFGRGAKDVSTLGAVRFRAIRDGKYSELLLNSHGEWRMQAEDEPATADQLSELGLGDDENGLTVELLVKEKISIPSRLQLQDKISDHAQLRDLIRRRSTLLIDKRGGDHAPVELQAPDLAGEVIIDEELPLVGYEPVHLVVRKLPQRQSGAVSPYSTHGLIIKSGVSAFENTWFDLDRRNEAVFFSGEVEAPEIARIIRAYDKGDSELGGPTRLLSRSRDGLIKEHPYRVALAQAITTRLKPVFDELATAMDGDRRGGKELKKAIDVARAALRDQIRELLDEIDDDDEGPVEESIADLAIIPPRRIAAPNESLTFTVRAVRKPVGELSARVETAHPAESMASVAASEAEWIAHDRLPAYQTNVYAMTGDSEGTAVVSVEVDGMKAYATITVRQPSPGDETPPDVLDILPSNVRIAPRRTKHLLVRAPMELEGTVILVSCDSDLLSLPANVTLRPEPGGRWVQARLRAVAGESAGTAVVHVWGADQSASATVSVEDGPMQGGLDTDLELLGTKRPDRRSSLIPDHGVLKVTVYANHPSFDGVFGKYSEEESKFVDEDSPVARAVLAEVFASELAGFFTERAYDKKPEELSDATIILRRRADFAQRLLSPLYRSLKPGT